MITIDKETTYLIGFTEDAVTELMTYLSLTLTHNIDNEFMPYEYTKIAITLYDELQKSLL